MKKVQQPCTRCGGSGHFSFHLVKGTVCFGCNGTGYRLVDPAREAAQKARVAKRKALEEARRELMVSTLEAVIAELNPLYGPFDVGTQLGMQQLNYATVDALGKTIYAVRDERLDLITKS